MKSPNPIPPKRAEQFLQCFVRDELAEEVLGDLEEKFYTTLEEKSPFKAKLNYWYQVFNYLRPFALKYPRFLNFINIPMYKHNFLISWRILLRNKAYSLLNIGGLVLGMTVAMLIGLWIYDELSYNKSFPNYEHIAKLTVSERNPSTGERFTGHYSPFPLAAELRSTYGDDFIHVAMATRIQNYTISTDHKKFSESGQFMAPEMTEMLKLNMRSGSRSGLQNMHTILLSESLANKLFGASEPVNKSLKVDDNSLTIIGVYKDFPRNTEFSELAFILPWDLYISLNSFYKENPNDWNNSPFITYAQIAPQTSFKELSSKIKEIGREYLDESNAAWERETFLHPMSKWHLYDEFDQEAQITMSEPMKFVWFYGLIGVFVLLLACINFMNLSTARSEKRAKEVGIRKAVGSIRAHLIKRFLVESFLISALAFIISLGLVNGILPWFNEIADKEMSLLWSHSGFWLVAIGFTLITALLAGSYPAFYLSALRPVEVLKGTFKSGHLTVLARKVLVVFQFTVSIALIIATLIIYEQIQFSKNRPLGYEQAGLIRVFIPSLFRGKEDIFRSELKKTGVVSEMTASASRLTNIRQNNPFFDWKGKDPNLKVDFGFIAVTPEYGKTIGWELLEGRDFSREFPTDSAGFVINEAAATFMELDEAVGEIIRWNPSQQAPVDFTVLGVVKDMVMRSPFEEAKPTVFLLQGDKPWTIVKVDPAVNMREALTKIEDTFEALYPSLPFTYIFVDEAYAEKFMEEERLGKMAGFFSVLAILISCLGLFGLAAFTAEQRTKEIGIRKVLGASVLNLWQMLCKDFVWLVVISCLIAMPIAYYFLDQWLQNYPYRTDIYGWMLVAVGLGALLITLLTVSFQAIKVANANPVDALRSE